MTALWTFVAILLALVAQAGLTLLLPSHAVLFDPLLLITVYLGLRRGETDGMLAGAATGWAQEVAFGGDILGFQALARLIVGFLVGLAGRRFLLTGALSQAIVILAAALLDHWLATRLAAMFEVARQEVSWTLLLARLVFNAALGALVFRLAERIEARLQHETVA